MIVCWVVLIAPRAFSIKSRPSAMIGSVAKTVQDCLEGFVHENTAEKRITAKVPTCFLSLPTDRLHHEVPFMDLYDCHGSLRQLC